MTRERPTLYSEWRDKLYSNNVSDVICAAKVHFFTLC